MAFPRPVLAAMLEAIGESDTLIVGHLETFLVRPLAWDATEIVVASTNRWPDPATIDIDGEEFSVTTKNSTTFTIVERPEVLPSTAIITPGARVVDISREYSDYDTARKQLLVAYATGEYLARIGVNYGVPRPAYHGRALFLTDDQFREYLQVVSFLRAGPLWGIMRVLESIFPPTILTGSVSSSAPQRISFSSPMLPSGLKRGLVRLAGDWSKLHRIIAVDPSGYYIDVLGTDGPTWVAADFDTVVEPPGVSVELLPWDVWEEPHRPGEFFIELYRSNLTGIPWGATYLQGGEEQTSDSTTQVTVDYDINQVLGVYLQADVARDGVNYWNPPPGGSSTFTGKIISGLDTLPSASEPVLVDYGSIDPSTAQLLEDMDVENEPPGTYWPFYLTDYGAILTESGILDIIRALGMLPVVSSSTWWWA